MSERGKLLIQRLIDAFNGGDFAAADQLFAASYTRHIASEPDLRGADAWKEMAKGFRVAFPDMVVAIDAIIEEGDLVATRWTARGMHRASLMGEVPTNREITIRGILLSRILDDRIAEEWEYYEERAMFAAIGATPPSVQAT